MEHDECVRATLQRMAEQGLTANVDKCKFGATSLEFFGFTISDKAISPSTEKVEAIKAFNRPTTPSEMRSFLGLATYVGRFIQNFATLVEALQHLIRKDSEDTWSTEHTQAFERLKREISSDTVMSHYDPDKKISLTVDASPVGLGAILAQVDDGGCMVCDVCQQISE